MLVIEVANLVIPDLAGASLNDNLMEFRYDENQFKAMEKPIIAYISGYVYGTMYWRICFFKVITREFS